MNFKFTPEDPVLDLGPRRPKEHANRISREYILWPAWAYRVVAPCVRPRQLNMFQRAVLGLCRAGLQEAEIIGKKLDIHSDLAAFILVEMMNLGYVDSDGSLTEQGLRVLTEDTDEDYEMVAGYVFQDPWTGELWPRFVERLDYCDLQYEENGFPTLLLGSKGKPKRQGAFMVFPKNALIQSRPSPANIVAAVSRHRKGLRYADNLTELDDNPYENDFMPSAVHINRVSFVEEEPAPVYLMTYLYLTDESADWYSCDPFGLGVSVRLRRRIEQTMDTMPDLHKVVSRLMGRGVHLGLEEQRRWEEQLRMNAAFEVERRLLVNIRSHDAYKYFVNMEFARQSAAASDYPDKLDNALHACRKALEALFGAIIRQFPLGDIWKRVYVTRINPQTGERYLVQRKIDNLLSTIYQTAAVEVGFEEPIPESLKTTRPGLIRSVAEYEELKGLRSLVMATVLLAQKEVDHPLRLAAKVMPSMLQDVDEIANWGDEGSHPNPGGVTMEDVDRTVECTYKVISVLLGVEPLGDQAAVSDSGVIHG